PGRARARCRSRVRCGGELSEAHHPRRCQPGERGRGRRTGAWIRVRTGRAMTRSARMEVLITIVETGVLPLFHSDDADRAARITGALREGGPRRIDGTDH